jgi:hypothetical protein
VLTARSLVTGRAPFPSAPTTQISRIEKPGRR